MMKFEVTTGSYRVGKTTYNRGDIVETETDLREVFGKECFELVSNNITNSEEPEDETNNSQSEGPKPKRKATRRRRKKK